MAEPSKTGESRIGVGRFMGALDVTLDLPLASVGSRGLAALVDMLLFLFFLLFVGAAATLIGGFLPVSMQSTLWTVVVVLFFVSYWGLFALIEWVTEGQSPGKRMLSLRVVCTDGSSAPPLAILLRNLGRYVDFLPGFYGIGVAVMLLHSESRRVGDLLAGTVVVREREILEGSASRRWPERFPSGDAALIESFFDRIDSLEDQRREIIAAKILEWLRRDHPGFVGETPAGESPSATLCRLFRVYSAKADPSLRWLN